MIKLVETVAARNLPEFNAIIKNEVQSLPPALLPLQEGMTRSSYTTGENFQVMVLNVTQGDAKIRVKMGVFYTGVIAGCNCADDPSTVDEQPEYCELLFIIDTETAQAVVTLL